MGQENNGRGSGGRAGNIQDFDWEATLRGVCDIFPPQCCFDGECEQHRDMREWPDERNSSYWTFDLRQWRARDRWRVAHEMGDNLDDYEVRQGG